MSSNGDGNTNQHQRLTRYCADDTDRDLHGKNSSKKPRRTVSDDSQRESVSLLNSNGRRFVFQLSVPVLLRFVLRQYLPYQFLRRKCDSDRHWQARHLESFIGIGIGIIFSSWSPRPHFFLCVRFFCSLVAEEAVAVPVFLLYCLSLRTSASKEHHKRPWPLMRTS